MGAASDDVGRVLARRSRRLRGICRSGAGQSNRSIVCRRGPGSRTPDVHLVQDTLNLAAQIHGRSTDRLNPQTKAAFRELASELFKLFAWKPLLSFDANGLFGDRHASIKKSERTIVVFGVWKLMPHTVYNY